jgi:hypothetical protein
MDRALGSAASRLGSKAQRNRLRNSEVGGGELRSLDMLVSHSLPASHGTKLGNLISSLYGS